MVGEGKRVASFLNQSFCVEEGRRCTEPCVGWAGACEFMDDAEGVDST